jgi:hypothetical protein
MRESYTEARVALLKIARPKFDGIGPAHWKEILTDVPVSGTFAF